MCRKGWLTKVGLLAVGSACLLASSEAAAKPNFVVIFTDDQGYADLSCYGGSHVSTPRIDQMAAEGARLTSFYVAAPLCTPLRVDVVGKNPKSQEALFGVDCVTLAKAK